MMKSRKIQLRESDKFTNTCLENKQLIYAK